MNQKKTREDWMALLRGVLQKKNALFILGLSGILLIFLSDALFAGRPKEEAALPEAEPQGARAASTEQALETRLAELISQVEGAGSVRVMLTLENAGETVYAYDEQSDTQTVYGGEGGAAERSQSYENRHVMIEAENGTQALVETCLEPEVKGVAVVCEGGDDITVIKRVTELVSVVLRLPTNRVCVIKMTETEDAS